MLSTAPQAAAFWSGLLLVLMVVLSFRVIARRRAHKTLLGDGGHEPLVVATRAFGNAAEYIPAGIAALTLLAVLKTSFYEVHAVGGLLFIGRLLHSGGLSASKLTASRMVGMVLTFLAYLIAAGALILKALTPISI